MSLADPKYIRPGSASLKLSSKAESEKGASSETTSMYSDSTRASSVSGTPLQEDEKQPMQNALPRTVQTSTGRREVSYSKSTLNNQYPLPAGMSTYLSDFRSDDGNSIK
ncbi:hypothetical protein DdX_22342 [Ditylenchus destructor]|nr:hypothetical protein DdX_22342 [Ditylenchus destructor]